MVLTWVSLFIFLAVINLINPEVREDQYHVDFPKMYLNNQTIMILPKEGFNVSGSPMLGEMYYTIGIFLWSQESARYIHFIFYILVLLTLLEFSKVNDYKFSIYNLLLFASAPVVIHETSSMYVDFEWMFCFLLSILILTLNKKLLSKRIVISGFILGGMLASKLWTIVFIPVSIIYLLILLSGLGINEKFKKISLFILSSLVAPLLWFIRAYILTGDPLFPAFFHNSTSTNNGIYYYLSHYLGLNNTLLNPYNLINVFSPLFFLGCIIFLYKFKQNLKEFLKLDIFKYLILLFLVFISIQYSYGRYLMGLYILLIFFSSLGLSKFISDFKFTKYLINFFLILFYLYYFVNSILILPYSLGITDRNKYLTRILSRDNSSYYNFNRQFEKYIFKNDYVATYGIFGYYYADFRYLNVNFVIDQKENSFDILKKNEFTKLFIKGGDINWFCLKENIKNCEKSKYTYLSSYMGTLPYYLYDIK